MTARMVSWRARATDQIEANSRPPVGGPCLSSQPVPLPLTGHGQTRRWVTCRPVPAERGLVGVSGRAVASTLVLCATQWGSCSITTMGLQDPLGEAAATLEAEAIVPKRRRRPRLPLGRQAGRPPRHLRRQPRRLRTARLASVGPSDERVDRGESWSAPRRTNLQRVRCPRQESNMRTRFRGRGSGWRRRWRDAAVVEPRVTVYHGRSRHARLSATDGRLAPAYRSANQTCLSLATGSAV